jgi:hypothetical protein
MTDFCHKLRNVGPFCPKPRKPKKPCSEIVLKQGWCNCWSIPGWREQRSSCSIAKKTGRLCRVRHCLRHWHWLGYDYVALAVLVIGLGAVELLAAAPFGPAILVNTRPCSRRWPHEVVRNLQQEPRCEAGTNEPVRVLSEPRLRLHVMRNDEPAVAALLVDVGGNVVDRALRAVLHFLCPALLAHLPR